MPCVQSSSLRDQVLHIVSLFDMLMIDSLVHSLIGISVTHAVYVDVARQCRPYRRVHNDYVPIGYPMHSG